MALSRDDVHKIALLARLRITDAEAGGYADTLSRIFDLVEQMQAVNTDGVEPMAHPTDQPLRLRDDVVTESDQRDKFLALAPAAEAGLYLVPKVIDPE